MRFVSPVALGLMLGLAGTTMLAAPAAVAKEKEKAPAEAKRNYSKELIAAVQPVQKAAQAKDYAGMTAGMPAVEAAVKTPDDKFMLGNLQLNLGIGQNDKAMQRKGLETMLASGADLGADGAKFAFFAGQLALDAKDYDPAIANLTKATEQNYPGSSTPLLLAEAYFQKAISLSESAKGQLVPAAKPVAAQGLPYLKKAIEMEKAAGTAVPATWYNRGFTMSYLAGTPDAAEWSRLNLAADPSPRNWRIMVRGYQDSHPQLTRPESLDLMRLALATGSLESEYDFAEYADAAQRSGLLGEVKAVIEKGRATGKLAPTKLNDIYTIAADGVGRDKASLPASEAAAGKAANGKLASTTGDAYLGYGDYAKAISLYRLALQKGAPDANETNTHLGIALALSGDTAGAKAAFGTVSGTGARKDIADMWLTWLDLKKS
ncbi:hypothetical protein PX699_17195 [Sphingobium sp. H39-3-25]|uniref:hypothetical protein n=1 Tax=Sphingobium arseniciresistens TaxID=3030834 RepID=UPI0023B997A3|nr:hypothetical protein [Sphingobium arseniciresistens]